MDQLVEELRSYVEGTIDFAGQAKAEKYGEYVSIGGISLSILIGLLLQNFQAALVGIALSYVAALVLCLPFSFYRKNPITWTAL